MALKKDPNEAPKTPPSELDELAAQAAAVDAEHNGTLPNGEAIADQPAAVDYGLEAAGMVDTFAALISGYCPEAGELWTPTKKAAVTAALAPVLEKYGFTLGNLPCEIVLAIVAGPLLWQTAKLIAAQNKRETAAAQAAKAPSAQTKPAATQAPSDTPKQERHPQEALYS